MKHSSESRGFTLIELLVVIAIIGLLSSIVLSSLNQARIKSRNAQRQQEAAAYAKAVELYQTNFGKYPPGSGIDWTPPLNNTNAYVCFGMSSSNTTCSSGVTYSGNDALNTQIAPYMQSVSAGVATGVALLGYGYACLDANCNSYRIIFQLEGGGQKNCAGGLVVSNSGSYTNCEIIQCSLGTKPVLSAGAGSPYVCS